MKSIRIPFKCIILTVILLSLSGCPYDSEFPLNRSEEACIDTELLGRWVFKSTDPKESGTVTISPFNEHELLIILREEGKINRDYYRAYTGIIGGDKFLSVREISPSSEKKSWVLVNYSISQGELKIRIVEDKLFKERFNSPAALAGFIEAHLRDKDLYGEDGGKVPTFIRDVSSRFYKE